MFSKTVEIIEKAIIKVAFLFHKEYNEDINNFEVLKSDVFRINGRRFAYDYQKNKIEELL
jgi:hypothetical protein